MADAFHRMEEMGDVRGKRILVRVDFNVPLDPATGQITDDSRIQGSLPTLGRLLEQGGRVIAMSHRGRPQKPNPQDSLQPVVDYLRNHLTCPVHFAPDIQSEPAVVQASQDLKPGELLVLENLRFHPGEKANSREFAQFLASLGDIYVNDAFGTAHREDASIVGVPEWLPAYAGLLMAQELDALNQILTHPRRPYWAIIGGAKVSDKVKLLARLLDLVDGLVIGGGMANTFLAAQGYEMGRSLVEADAIGTAKDLLAAARSQGIPVILPTDVIAARKFAADAPGHRVALQDLGPEDMALDIGPATIQTIVTALSPAHTVLWNGPMGVFEFDAFAQGTLAVARDLATLEAAVVVGGGDSVAAVNKAGVKDRLTHISTGGGATLRYLEGEDLPGIRALKHAVRK
ncbi:MAG: phosphoglycerate kinase [Firmicutes bacterium]|jgi:phosphoglycerate kinase|uniref:Phosphoglycerate kinase n=1 Tax=Sulfobacillus benefaciens TaxID=453960 RepID=A0A2T2WZW8_9FIRM|nr:phosphoglycerate kinase [Bacillota bacterium]MCL5014150.1 phosphoglycerate kinase [Bacillota bacterium]PSR27778.1 MAG: phosphoglycerate kinase [Sulfobacillus benefaciens]